MDIRNQTFADQISYSTKTSCDRNSLSLYSTGSNSVPYGIAMGDFNNDGKVDIAVANYGSKNVGIFLGYGNGTFAPQTIYPTSDGSGSAFVAIADLNHDGWYDIASANYDTGNVCILLGHGDGTFADQTVYSTGDGSQPNAIAIVDLNNDERYDIAVANFGTNNIGIFLGYGDGTFADQTVYSTGDGSQPNAIAIVDFNNDERYDIAVANFGTNNVGIFLGYGDGTFAPQTTYSTGDRSAPNAIAIVDLNKDGRYDIAVANAAADNAGIFVRIWRRHFCTSNNLFNRQFFCSVLNRYRGFEQRRIPGCCCRQLWYE